MNQNELTEVIFSNPFSQTHKMLVSAASAPGKKLTQRIVKELNGWKWPEDVRIRRESDLMCPSDGYIVPFHLSFRRALQPAL